MILTFFATHPQSYYRTGGANPDFPGIARQLRETATGGVPHIHFNGAGGDIGAGKWNDGAKGNRLNLALRLAAGMEAAWGSMEKVAVTGDDVSWSFQEVELPVSEAFTSESLEATLSDPDATLLGKKEAAAHLAWQWRRMLGHRPAVSCLRLGETRALFGPGEMVVDYQLFVQGLTERFVALAGYGDYGPGYICLTKQYAEGGYEASPRASRVAPRVESVLKPVLRELLQN